MRIGEVSRRSGVSARMLRHYDDLGLAIPSGRSSAGYREYSSDDIVRIFHIESLRALGLSLREVGQALDDPDFAPADLVADLTARARERIVRAQELVDRLQQVSEAGPQDWEQVLDVVALLSGLESAHAAYRQRAALAVADGAAPADALVRALLAEDDENVAGALRWALTRSGAEALPMLAAAMSDGDAVVRRRAVLALAEVPESSEVLRTVVADDDPVVRSRATQALADRGDTGVVGALVDRIVDGIADVDAGEALASLGDPSSVDRLAAALRDADAPARRRIAQALGEIGGAAAADVLATLVHDSDEGTSATARYLLTRRKATAPNR